MERNAKILGNIDKAMLGIEVAPWLAPLAPKSEGYNVRTLDVFDRATLLARAKTSPETSHRDMSLLEDVDYVGSATEIATLIPYADHGSFDYIVSAHNFEHIPNPIKFLQGCAKILKRGGVLSMAVPDRRACFDYFRPNTQIGDWLEAYVTDRKKPTQRQIFDVRSKTAFVMVDNKPVGAFDLGVRANTVGLTGELSELYEKYFLAAAADGYEDAHCTVMSPASLDLLLTEARYLGLIDCSIEIDGKTVGCEFYVRLRFGVPVRKLTAEQFQVHRLALQQRVLTDYSAQIQPASRQKTGLFKSTPLSRKIRGYGRYLRGKPDR
jgi:SAM-dependent methyltransferase